MKKLLLLVIMAVAFMSCEKDNLNETPLPEARIIGEWETFKVEKQELILDFNTDGSLNQSMQWYDQTSQFSTESTLAFNEDYSFNDYYAVNGLPFKRFSILCLIVVRRFIVSIIFESLLCL